MPGIRRGYVSIAYQRTGPQWALKLRFGYVSVAVSESRERSARARDPPPREGEGGWRCGAPEPSRARRPPRPLAGEREPERGSGRRRPESREEGARPSATPNRGRRREQGRPAPPLHHEPRLRPAPRPPWPPREGAGRREGDPARRGRRAAAPSPSTRSGGRPPHLPRLPPSSPVPAREAGGAPLPAWGE